MVRTRLRASTFTNSSRVVCNLPFPQRHQVSIHNLSNVWVNAWAATWAAVRVFRADYRRRQRALAAFFAISLRFLAERPCARALPPFRPSSTAALLFPSSVSPNSSISPVAIRMTVTAFEITSAGRLWPFGVRGMLSGKDSMRGATMDVPINYPPGTFCDGRWVGYTLTTGNVSLILRYELDQNLQNATKPVYWRFMTRQLRRLRFVATPETAWRAFR
jgi:hypothetical protein